MPKLKTHRGTAKRIKLTAHSLLRAHANNTHNRSKMSAARKRSLASVADVRGSIAHNLKRALGR